MQLEIILFLLVDDFLSNKCFVISRSGSQKEIYNNLSNASSFIHEALSDSKQVWIAQRQGRAKDGLDKTDSAVLK